MGHAVSFPGKLALVGIAVLMILSMVACRGGDSLPATVADSRSWYHPESLTDNISPDGQDAGSPQVAMDNDGNTIIVWQQSNGTVRQIFKSEYRNGSWAHPTALTDNISPNGQDTYNPQVAMDDNGNAIIVWHQYEGPVSQIFKSEYRNGAWTHPASLTDNISPDGYMASDSDVVMDDNGNAIIVWHQHEGSFWQIFKSEYRNGAWTHPADIADKISLDDLDARAPKAAMDNNGNAIIVWEHDGVTGITAESIFKSEYRNGSWTHPADFDDRLNPDGLSASALTPSVAMGDSGNAIIVWRQYCAGGHEIFKSEYR